MRPDLPPFACTYTPAFAELLAQLNCSLVVSTYQAGKLIALSSDGDRIIQLPRTFHVPMGLAFDGRRLAVATQQEVIVLVDAPELGLTYPQKPGTYDGMFLPRAVYYTGQLSLHDMVWTGGKLIAANTTFSCLSEIDADFSFRPCWKPAFISELAHEDRCHLNGLAADAEGARYVTALAPTDVRQGWRPEKTRSGVLMDVRANAILAHNLPMPHSPRLIGDELYLLLSATGEVVRVDRQTGEYTVINQINGFVRGMDCYGDYLFVASSKLRKTHTFGDLPLARRPDLLCGLTIIHLPTGALVAQLGYQNSCDEIYDVRVLPDRQRPNLLNHHQETHRAAVVIPDATFWGVPTERAPSPAATLDLSEEPMARTL